MFIGGKDYLRSFCTFFHCFST